MNRIRAFYLTYLERILEAARGKIDMVLTGHDFGAQNAPLISPEMWTTFLGDGFAQYVALAKQADVRVMHHTCGSVRPIIPLMLERGLDILQSLQPEAADMDPRWLKAEFGDRLAFLTTSSADGGTPSAELERQREWTLTNCWNCWSVMQPGYFAASSPFWQEQPYRGLAMFPVIPAN